MKFNYDKENDSLYIIFKEGSGIDSEEYRPTLLQISIVWVKLLA